MLLSVGFAVPGCNLPLDRKYESNEGLTKDACELNPTVAYWPVAETGDAIAGITPRLPAFAVNLKIALSDEEEPPDVSFSASHLLVKSEFAFNAVHRASIQFSNVVIVLFHNSLLFNALSFPSCFKEAFYAKF